MQDRYSNIISNTCIKKTIIELESKIQIEFVIKKIKR